MLRIFLVLLMALFATGTLMATDIEYKGKTFWVGFLESEIGPDPFQLSVHITSTKETTVTVKLPAAVAGSRGEKDWTATYQVSPGKTTDIIIPDEYTFKAKNGKVTNKGLFIEAEDDIMVVAKNSSGASSDATIVIPVSSLGSEYFIMQYGVMNRKYPTQYIILATEDSTEVELFNTMMSSQGNSGSYTVKLNKGDYHLVESEKDLTGSWVKEKNGRKVAVFSGSTCSYVPQYCQSCDHLFEQLTPVTSWGHEFAVAPFDTRKSYVVRIMAKTDDTYVDINGRRQKITRAGKFLELELKEAIYITATQPVLVCQYSIGTRCDENRGDPSMVVVRPLLSFSGTQKAPTLYTEKVTHHYVTVVFKSDDRFKITINGKPITGYDEEIPYRSEYSFAHIELLGGMSNTIECNCEYNFTTYGFGWYESYAY